MADFVAVLRKTIDGLADPTPELRQRVYAKARATIEQKLATLNAPEAVAVRQKQALEDAISEVESDFAPALEDLMHVPDPVPVAPPVAPPPPVVPAPVVAKPEPAPVMPPKPAPVAPPPVVPAPSFTKPIAQSDALEDFLTTHTPSGAKPIEPREEGFRNERTDERPLAGSSSGAAGNLKSGRGPEEEFDDEPEFKPEDRGSSDYGVYSRGPLKQPKQKRSLVPLLGLLGLLILIGGGAYAGWTYKDQIAARATSVKTYLASLTGGGDKAPAKPAETAANPPATPPAKTEQPAQPAAPTAQPAAPTAPAGEAKPEPKLTQRLLPDGQEINPGPANDTPSLGEGTSVAASTPDQQPATQPPAQGQQTPPAGQATPPPAALPIGQKAFFYEERSGQDAGTADAGGVVWSVVQESPGNDLPPEPAIRAEVTIPDRGIKLRMVIRRNGDKTLPASHLVEMIFTVPDKFPGGSIDAVSRMTLKDTEQAPGSPLVGIPAKIADNFFIIAMNDAKTAVDTNMSLLRRQSWIDVPIAYKTGRRALLTLEKGLPGEKVFDEVLKAWAAKAGG